MIVLLVVLLIKIGIDIGLYRLIILGCIGLIIARIMNREHQIQDLVERINRMKEINITLQKDKENLIVNMRNQNQQRYTKQEPKLEIQRLEQENIELKQKLEQMAYHKRYLEEKQLEIQMIEQRMDHEK